MRPTWDFARKGKHQVPFGCVGLQANGVRIEAGPGLYVR